MSINSIENAKRYSTELDKMFAQKSATGFFADNALATKFVGAKTVIIPDVDFQGLADYDRDTGFSRGAITVSNASYTMAMDRARSLQIDREDMDETGIANLAGKILGEYVRTKVVPECDAYVLSKLAGLAQSRANLIEGDVSAPFEALTSLINEVQSVVGYDEELVAFIDSHIFAALQNSAEISKMITVSDFKQGEIDLKVNTINGVSLIPVVRERMQTAYNFTNSGFVAADNAKEVYMLVCPKDGAHLMKKTENMRIFTPEQNPDADAFKFDYRIYYDVFVKKSGMDAVWAWIAPEINIKEQPYISENSVIVNAEATDATLSYQWYSCQENGGNATKIVGATSSVYELPDELNTGNYFFFVVITADGLAKKTSEIVQLSV